VVLYVLAMHGRVLGFTAASVVLKSALTTNNPGYHGLSEILYAMTSAGNNNGSAFAGLDHGDPVVRHHDGLVMLVGRFFLAIPVLAIAGAMARKQSAPETVGTFPTHTPLFGGLVIGGGGDRRRPDLLPGPGARPIVEHLSI